MLQLLILRNYKRDVPIGASLFIMLSCQVSHFTTSPLQTFGFVALALLLLELNFKPPLFRGIVCLWNMDGLK